MEESENLIKMTEISVWVAENSPHIINRSRNSERIVMGKREGKKQKDKRMLSINHI